ncbi:MAG: SdpI family protein, partial [Bacteroidales bacterium]|nr:SdpI family protein [Bacteroidales bacterium]
TLENEQVWKKTHRLGGRIWLVGGVSIAILAFFVTYKIIFTILFVLILSFMVVVPVLYSYIEFKKIKKA